MSYNVAKAGADFTGLIPVKAGENIEAGGVYGVDATGHIIANPAVAASIVGRAEGPADNTDGANGDIKIPLRRGVYVMSNSGVAPITDAHLHLDVYIEDPQTVTNAQTDVEPVAGRCLGLTPSGDVLVEIL